MIPNIDIKQRLKNIVNNQKESLLMCWLAPNMEYTFSKYKLIHLCNIIIVFRRKEYKQFRQHIEIILNKYDSRRDETIANNINIFGVVVGVDLRGKKFQQE